MHPHSLCKLKLPIHTAGLKRSFNVFLHAILKFSDLTCAKRTHLHLPLSVPIFAQSMNSFSSGFGVRQFDCLSEANFTDYVFNFRQRICQAKSLITNQQ